MNKIHIFIVVFYAFCVARVLPTTFGSYKKLRTSFTVNYKYKQNFDSTIINSDKNQA